MDRQSKARARTGKKDTYKKNTKLWNVIYSARPEGTRYMEENSSYVDISKVVNRSET